MESCSILSICFSEGSGSVLVTTTLAITEFLKRSMAGPLKEAVGGERVDVVGAALLQLLGRRAQGAAGADHVVDDHAGAALHLTDDLHRLHPVPCALHPSLVHDGEIGVEHVGVALGDLHPAGVGAHDDEVVGQVRLDVVDDHRHGGEVVDGSVEEALDLAGVQVDRHEPVGADGGEHVGDQLGGDRLAVLGLAVLTGVAVVRDHRGDALGRRPASGVDHDELLHDHVVHRHVLGRAVGLDHEDVGTAHVLAEAAVDLAVGEVDQVRVAQLHPQLLGDLLGQRQVRPAGEEVQALLRDQLHGVPS